jgi:hypothetical protein
MTFKTPPIDFSICPRFLLKNSAAKGEKWVLKTGANKIVEKWAQIENGNFFDQ